MRVGGRERREGGREGGGEGGKEGGREGVPQFHIWHVENETSITIQATPTHC